MLKSVPNVLSALRLGLAFVYPALPAEWRLTAIVAGALSDWMDGLIARRYRATSTTGMLLDAVADKLFTLSVLVTAVVVGDVLWWQVVLVLARDITVTAVSAWCVFVLRRPDAFRHMRPRMPGKITTTFLFAWLIATVAGAPPTLNWTLFALAAGSSIVAAADYLGVFALRLRLGHHLRS